MIKHDKVFCHKKFRGTYSSVGMLMGYMLICRNAEGVHDQRKVEKSCSIWFKNVFVFNDNFMFVKIVHYISRNNEQAG